MLNNARRYRYEQIRAFGLHAFSCILRERLFDRPNRIINLHINSLRIANDLHVYGFVEMLVNDVN